MSGDAEPLHLISWNVAGWDTALRGIVERSGSLAKWLEQHRCDVLCLQEVKISADTLSKPKAATGARTPGYESYWACAEGARTRSGGQGRGLNGVTTFARVGSVRSANPAPLGDPELDREGRCIMTDHGDFCLFNVYVPNSGAEYKRLPFKLRFLKALRAAMQAQRAAGKHVVLCGDLNVGPRPDDVYYAARRIRIRDRIRDTPSPEVANVHAVLQRCWDGVEGRLRAAEPRQETISVSSQWGQQVEKWRLIAVAPDGSQVKLGKPEFSRDDLGFSTAGYTSGGLVAVPPGCLSVAELQEAVEKLAPAASQHVTPQEWRLVADIWGEAPYPPGTLEWVAALRDDGMQDSFAVARPSARARFTVFSQYLNRRYFNQGSRIDAFFVDEPLWKRCGAVGGELGCGPGAPHPDPTGEAAALAAVTARGLLKPAAFSGGGIPPCPKEAHDAQFRAPHTGILYTPPEHSDHIPVTLILRSDDALRRSLSLRSDASTRKSQPHKQQQTLTAFFGAPAAKKPKVQQP